MQSGIIEGRTSILVNREYTTIEIEDAKASTRFLRIQLTPEQLSMCLSRQSCVPCEIKLNGIDKIGKKHENKDFVFEIPKELSSPGYGDVDNSQKLAEIAQKQLTDGWIADLYFRSQNSFFKQGDKNYARCVIRRWI